VYNNNKQGFQYCKTLGFSLSEEKLVVFNHYSLHTFRVNYKISTSM